MKQFIKVAIIMIALVTMVLPTLLLPLFAHAATISPEIQSQVLQVIKENPKALIESVQNYQVQQQELQIENQSKEIKKAFQKPRSLIGKSYTLGNQKAKHVLVEFSDFECPYCAQASKVLKEFSDIHKEDVLFVYKYLPLIQIHDQALPAALASYAAGKQGKFWEYQEALFANQKNLGDKLFVSIAKELNLDLNKFKTDRTSEESFKVVEEDLMLASKFGVMGTPFLVIDGEVFSGEISVKALETFLISKTA